MRPLPDLTPENTPFWTGGARGELMITHCDDCDHAIHPPQLICPKCLSRKITPRAAKGTGVIYSYTVNHQPWMPHLKVPLVLAIADLDGEPGVRLTAELVDVDPDTVAIGQPVRVSFVEDRDCWIPQFRR